MERIYRSTVQKKILVYWITAMVWSPPRATYSGE